MSNWILFNFGLASKCHRVTCVIAGHVLWLAEVEVVKHRRLSKAVMMVLSSPQIQHRWRKR